MNQLQTVLSSKPKPQGLSGLYLRAKQATVPNATQSDAARQLLTILGIGLAGGVGARGLSGAYSAATAPEHAVQPSTQLPPTIHIGPQRDEKKKPRPLGLPAPQSLDQPKMAVDKSFMDPVYEAVGKILPKVNTSKALVNGWGIPAGLATGAAGITGGYNLADWLLKKEKTVADNSELDSAAQEYQQALDEQYRTAMQAKHAGDDLGIDSLSDIYQTKEAFFPLVDMISGC